MQGCCGMVTIVTAERGKHNFSPKMHITGFVFAGRELSHSLNNRRKWKEVTCFTAIKGETQTVSTQWEKYALGAVLVCPGSHYRQKRPKQNLSFGFIYLIIYLIAILCIFSNNKMIRSEAFLFALGISTSLWTLSGISAVCCAGASLTQCHSHGSVLQVMDNLPILPKQMHQKEQ